MLTRQVVVTAVAIDGISASVPAIATASTALTTSRSASLDELHDTLHP
jgi:hypothetical protein